MTLPRLYAITHPALTPNLTEACEKALQGGIRLLQYRNKQADTRTRFTQARALVELCRQYDAQLIINDESTLAKAVGADGVHLGQHDGDIKAARELLGPDCHVGVSCHGSLELAQQAVADGASYIAFGRFFSSQTKPDAPAAQLDILATAASLGVPRIAIGGITHDNARSVFAAGADSLAIIQGIFGQPDIKAASRHLCQIAEETA